MSKKPNRPEYIHPFGGTTVVPFEAEQMTVTFSAEITEGCIVGGGMDTYTMGNEIQEAIKAPWIDWSVQPNNPISYAVVRKSLGE